MNTHADHPVGMRALIVKKSYLIFLPKKEY